VNLAAEITALQGFLTTDSNGIGEYMHGNRFVVYFAGGGMEYDGGTTSSTGSLRHETHHSWWGRGLKPASQNDGWLDEAWTVYVLPLPPPAGCGAGAPAGAVVLAKCVGARHAAGIVQLGRAPVSGHRLFGGRRHAAQRDVFVLQEPPVQADHHAPNGRPPREP